MSPETTRLVTLRLLKELGGQHLGRGTNDDEDEAVVTLEPELHLDGVRED